MYYHIKLCSIYDLQASLNRALVNLWGKDSTGNRHLWRLSLEAKREFSLNSTADHSLWSLVNPVHRRWSPSSNINFFSQKQISWIFILLLANKISQSCSVPLGLDSCIGWWWQKVLCGVELVCVYRIPQWWTECKSLHRQ